MGAVAPAPAGIRDAAGDPAPRGIASPFEPRPTLGRRSRRGSQGTASSTTSTQAGSFARKAADHSFSRMPFASCV